MKKLFPAFLFFALSPLVFPAEMQDVFLENSEKILSGEISSVGEFCFGVGEAEQTGRSGTAKKNAEQKAALLARRDLVVSQLSAGIDWPETLSEGQIRQCKKVLKKYTAGTNSLQKSSIVSQSFKNGKFIFVVAAKIDENDFREKINFDKARETLLREEILLGGELPAETLLEIYKTRAQAPEPVARDDWKEILPRANFDGRLRHLKDFAGMFPIGTAGTSGGSDYLLKGFEFFNAGDFESAYLCFLSGTAKNFDFDSLCMAGRTAYELELFPEAAALFLHAHYLNRRSAYPLVYLAKTAKALGAEALFEKYAALAETTGDNDWTKAQIEELMKNDVSEEDPEENDAGDDSAETEEDVPAETEKFEANDINDLI